MQLPILVVCSQAGSGTSFHCKRSPWETLKVVCLSRLPPATRHWNTQTHARTDTVMQVEKVFMWDVCLFVCRRESGSSDPAPFEALGCHEQLGQQHKKDSEDPREYCYGMAESPNALHHPLKYLITAAILLSPASPSPQTSPYKVAVSWYNHKQNGNVDFSSGTSCEYVTFIYWKYMCWRPSAQ